MSINNAVNNRSGAGLYARLKEELNNQKRVERSISPTGFKTEILDLGDVLEISTIGTNQKGERLEHSRRLTQDNQKGDLIRATEQLTKIHSWEPNEVLQSKRIEQGNSDIEISRAYVFDPTTGSKTITLQREKDTPRSNDNAASTNEIRTVIFKIPPSPEEGITKIKKLEKTIQTRNKA